MKWPRCILTAVMCIAAVPNAAVAQQEEDGLSRDAREMAKMKGITQIEAIRRLNLQNRLNELISKFGDEDNFVSADIEATRSKYSIRLRIAPSGVAAILRSPIIVDPLISKLIRVETAPFSNKQLSSAQSKIFKALSGQKASTRIDATTGKLVVQTRDPSTTLQTIAQLGLEHIATAEKRDDFPTPIAGLLDGFLGGGLPAVTSNGSNCTSGFTVNRSGVFMITTAGHCVLASPNSTTYLAKQVFLEGSPITVDSASWSGSRDVAYLFSATSSTSNKIYDGSGPRAITSGFYGSGSYGRVANGTLLCKYGTTTKYTCQDVTNNNWTAVDSNGVQIGPLVQLGGTIINIAQCGDSGGPVFSGAIAYGTVSRGDANGSVCSGGSILLYAPLSPATPVRTV